VNPKCLPGEGPDVLFSDRVDYTTHILMVMLLNVSDIVPQVALQSDIIDPFMTDGRLYLLLARLIVPTLCGDAGTLDGSTDLNDLQETMLAVAPRPDTEQYSDEYFTAVPDDQKYALALASGVDFANMLSAFQCQCPDARRRTGCRRPDQDIYLCENNFRVLGHG